MDGVPYAMSPTPSLRHQAILGELAAQIVPAFRGQRCRPILAPFDVKFDDLNCTEPDLMIVCDPRQIKANHIEGPPALVVEVVSDHGVVRDRVNKLRLYARFGVKEYWIITQWQPMIEVLLLDGDTYRVVGSYRKEDAFQSPSFPGLNLNLSVVFDYPPGPGDAIEVVKEPPGRYAQMPVHA